EKVALIDTVEPVLQNEFLENLKEFKNLKIDYIVAEHAEQDHSGSIPKILEIFKEAKVVTNEKCKELLIEHLHIDEDRIIVVQDGEKLSLGNRTLTFILTPWVHWPETMSVLLEEDKILFTCDFFGAHYSTSKLFAGNDPLVLEAAKRYYAEIMMPFRSFIRTNMKKLENFTFDMIAPSHGPIWNDPHIIIDAYNDWISDNVKNKVLIPYVSMHGSTKILVDRLVDKLTEKGIEVVPFNLTVADLGNIAINMVDAATIVLAFPTVLTGPHPLGAYITFFANMLRPKTQFVAVITSFGWGGTTIDWVKTHTKNLKAEILAGIEVKGLPYEKDLEQIDVLSDKIELAHKSIGIL
nr:FprA family A-type flavoprotein [Candidatus Atribacteria bacterium]